MRGERQYRNGRGERAAPVGLGAEYLLDVVVMQHGKTKEVISEVNMGSSVYGTFVAANGKLFVTNRNQLIALQEGAKWDGKVK